MRVRQHPEADRIFEQTQDSTRTRTIRHLLANSFPRTILPERSDSAQIHTQVSQEKEAAIKGPRLVSSQKSEVFATGNGVDDLEIHNAVGIHPTPETAVLHSSSLAHMGFH